MEETIQKHSTNDTKTQYTQVHTQGGTQKFLDNSYKTQITSYMDTIYFYSSTYIPS